MRKWKKRTLIISGSILGIVLLLTIVFWKKINEFNEIMKYSNLFKPELLVKNFQSMYTKYPYKTVNKSGDVYVLKKNLKPLPETYMHKGQTKSISEWIEWTNTTGLLVIKDGEIVFEKYYQGYNEETLTISMSVAKSMISFLLGTAIDEGKISDIHDPVDKYAPGLIGSGYENVSIKDVLQMSSGIRYTEDYDDLNCDFVKMIAAFTTGSINDFLHTLKNEKPPGTYNRYISANTQVLGLVLANATGKSITELTREKLWSKLGVEKDAMWLTDPKGTELSFGGFNAILRDYARFGLLYLNKGKNFKGEQLVSEEWIKASVIPDAPHLEPGYGNKGSEGPEGYGYHWWIPIYPQGDFMAIGIYGQFIYINPENNVVIAKTSTYKDYDYSGLDMEYESMDVFQTISSNIK